MCAADDVIEMKSISRFIAEKLVSSPKDKDRANALYAALNPPRKELVSWNRCFEFLKGKARTVQSWEKDLARAKRDELEAADRKRKAREHIEWLASIREAAVENGADVDRADLVAVERVLSRISALDSALGDTGETHRRRSTD